MRLLLDRTADCGGLLAATVAALCETDALIAKIPKLLDLFYIFIHIVYACDDEEVENMSD